MADILQPLKTLTDLRDPVLIAGFGVRQRGGRLAYVALNYLVDTWKGELAAELDPDDFMDFTVRRPEQRWSGNQRVLEWPKTQVHLARPEGSSRDFLLVGGFEPNFGWGRLVDSITAFADAAGVRTMVSLRSFPGSVPHTRPAPVNLTASDIELEVQFGIQAERVKYEGPADFAAVLGVKGQSLGWKTVELSVIQPYYLPRTATSGATMSLVRVLDHAFGLQTSVAPLEAAALDEVGTIEDSFSNQLEAHAMIQELEESYDEGAERLDFLSPGSSDSTLRSGDASQLPTGEELIQDIERLFREGGTPGN